MNFNFVKPTSPTSMQSSLVIESHQGDIDKSTSLRDRIFQAILKNNPITDKHIYTATCQYFIAVHNSLPKELRNPGSQGFIAWSACLKYMQENRAANEYKFSEGASLYLQKIATTIEGCVKELSVDIKSQISAKLKNLNLSSDEFLDDGAQSLAMEILKAEDCVDESGCLKGNWVMLCREDGRFFVVQDAPRKHLTDLLLQDLNLVMPQAGICKPHITINEGQARADVKNFVISKDLKIEDCNEEIMKDNQIEFNEKNRYFLVKTADAKNLEFPDIKVAKISVVNNPRPEVKRVFALRVESERMEKFKEELGLYPVNRFILPHVSLGFEFRKLEQEETPCTFKDVWSDVGGGDHISQQAEILGKMWPGASI